VAFEKSKLITPIEYNELVASRDLNEFVLKLRRSEYEIELRGQISLNYIEFELIEVLFAAFDKMIKHAPKKFQSFFRAYLIKYEMQNIKTLIRAFYKGVKKTELQYHYTVENILGRKDVITESLNASDLNTLIIGLQKLPYGDVIGEIFEIIEREKYSFFYLDLFLDLKYLEELWLAHNELGRRNREIVKKFIGLEIDSYNLETVLRAKNLGLEEHLVYRMISQHYYLLNEHFLEELIKNKLDIAMLLKYYKFKEKITRNLEDPETIRHLFKKELIKLIHSFYIKSGFNIGKPFAFLLNKELEIENLRSISIGIYYKRKPEEISGSLYIM